MLQKIVSSFFSMVLLTVALGGTAYASEVRPQIILVHGNLFDRSQFKPFLRDPALSSIADLSAENRPGYRNSDSETPHSNFDHQVHDLLNQVRTSRGPVVLVGYSYGAVIVLRAAELEPELISKIVLIAMPANPEKIVVPWLLIPAFLSGVEGVLPLSFRQAAHEIATLRSDLALTLSDLSKVRAKAYVIHGTEDSTAVADDLDRISSIHPITNLIQKADHSLIRNEFKTIRNLLLRIVQDP